MTPSKRRSKKLFKPLAIAALMAGGLLQPFMLPAFAAAGEQISNTATATYEDDSGTAFETESNTVVVTVKEIAGITVEPNGVDDPNGGSFEDGDTLNFNFQVTNVGNDTSDILLPATSDIERPGDNFVISQVNVFLSDGTTLINSYDDTATGQQSLINLDTIAAAGSGILNAGTNQLPANGLNASDFVIVQVVGTVDGAGLNPGDDITVTLGDTPPNDNSLATQNQAVDLVNNPARNVQTDDSAAEPIGTELAAADEKEASATQFVDFATQQKPLALATVKKSASNVDPGATGSADDDVITYSLTMEVESSSPNGLFIAEDLAATPILLDTTTTNGSAASSQSRILVSDAVPDNTEFNSTTLPRVPAGGDWVVVYSIDNPSTTSPVEASGGTAARWTTNKPDDNLIRRVGFIYDPASAADGPIDPGTTFTGFEFDVIANGLPAVGGSIYNLAQVFGTTYDDPAIPNDPVDQIIYDESGDDNPNNFENSNPPAETGGGTADGSDFDPTVDTGVADPTNHGTDDGTNTGIGPDGEDNEVILTGEEQTGDDNILNGPDGAPNAVGATDDDDDYTNKGLNPGNIGDSDTNNDSVSFVNTVANPSTNTSQIDNVTVTPINAATALFNDEDSGSNTNKYGNPSVIPNNTTVTISYDVDGDGTIEGTAEDETAVYTWNGTDWTTSDTPINIGTLQPGEEADYNVVVNFPDGATLNEGTVIDIPLIAFPDTGLDGYDGSGSVAGESVNNITLDRIYVGFMSVTKEARILDADGNVVTGGDWSETPSVPVESGYIIEYRLTYENTSPSLVGTGNVSLNAENFELIEDGDAVIGTLDTNPLAIGDDPDNNWHDDIAADSLTVHANGVTRTAGTVRYYSQYDDAPNVEIGTTDPADGSVVEAYVNEVGTVVPGGSGSMTIRRRVK